MTGKASRRRFVVAPLAHEPVRGVVETARWRVMANPPLSLTSINDPAPNGFRSSRMGTQS